MKPVAVGSVIDVLLKQKEMSQLQLAKKTKLSTNTVSTIILGKARLTIRVAHLFAEVIGIVTAKELLTIQLEHELFEYQNQSAATTGGGDNLLSHCSEFVEPTK